MDQDQFSPVRIVQLATLVQHHPFCGCARADRSEYSFSYAVPSRVASLGGCAGEGLAHRDMLVTSLSRRRAGRAQCAESDTLGKMVHQVYLLIGEHGRVAVCTRRLMELMSNFLSSPFFHSLRPFKCPPPPFTGPDGQRSNLRLPGK